MLKSWQSGRSGRAEPRCRHSASWDGTGDVKPGIQSDQRAGLGPPGGCQGPHWLGPLIWCWPLLVCVGFPTEAVPTSLGLQHVVSAEASGTRYSSHHHRNKRGLPPLLVTPHRHWPRARPSVLGRPGSQGPVQAVVVGVPWLATPRISGRLLCAEGRGRAWGRETKGLCAPDPGGSGLGASSGL